jgi:triosephosphate isomerase
VSAPIEPRFDFDQIAERSENMNIWHDIDGKFINKHDFSAVIEISKGSKNKYEMDKETGLLRLDRIIIAYEPVWAIGTGETATAEQANEVNHAIREVLGEIYCPKCASRVTIQYGGSMNAANAAELLAQVDVDGGLIGGASLKAADFSVIVKAASV